MNSYESIKPTHLPRFCGNSAFLPYTGYPEVSGGTIPWGRNFRIAGDTETISLWLNTHVLSTADSAFNRLLSDLNRLL